MGLGTRLHAQRPRNGVPLLNIYASYFIRHGWPGLIHIVSQNFLVVEILSLFWSMML
jgi:hypothetical protein